MEKTKATVLKPLLLLIFIFISGMASLVFVHQTLRTLINDLDLQINTYKAKSNRDTYRNNRCGRIC